MVTARDIMTTEVVSVHPSTEVTAAARLLLERRFNALPVVNEEGRLMGIICQSDLIALQKRLPLPSFFSLLGGLVPLSSLKHLEQEVRKMAAVTVGEAMTPDPVTVSPQTGLEDVAALMVEKGFHTLPVVESGRMVGVVGKEDVLRTLLS